jgi:LPS-assembly protein
LSFGAGNPILRVYTNYIDIESGAGSGDIEERKEISFGASSQFHENWKITANATRDMTSGGGMVVMTSGLTYEDECFSILSNYSRSFTRDRDLEPTDTIFVQLMFKGLGDQFALQTQETFQESSSDTANPI